MRDDEPFALELGQPRSLTFHCTIHSRPVPKAAICHTKDGKGYYPKSTKQAMRQIKHETLNKKIAKFSDPDFKPLTNPQDPMFTQAVKVTLVYAFIRPKSVKDHQRPYPSVVPDIDNLAKLTLDCLQPHIIKDDCLIVVLNKKKIYDDTEYTDITVEDLL